VLSASLDDGLLAIDLLRPEPRRLVRKIEIGQGPA
jgi:HSP20 family molecular chaperone IbpA